MPVITSRDHPLIKQLIRLESSASYRHRVRLTVLDGEHLLQTYLAEIGAPENLIVSQSYAEKGFDRLISTKPIKTTIVSDALFRAISPVKTPTGILGLIAIPTTIREIDGHEKEAFSVLLEEIQDPGNLGSVLRSAAAAGVGDVYLSRQCADAWSPKTLRAAMGAHFFLRIHENCDLIQIIQQFEGIVIASTLSSGKNLFSMRLTGSIAFIFGNEGAGLSHSILQAANEQITIPMPGRTESLNAAAAAAICLFEKVRQDKANGR